MSWKRVVRGLLWGAALLGVAASVYALSAPVQVHEVQAVCDRPNQATDLLSREEERC